MMIAPTSDKLSGSHLFTILWKAFRCVERYDRQSIEALGFGCLTDFAVLEALRGAGSLSVSALGAKVLLTSGSITTAVERLQRKGWVCKDRNPLDGRGVVVSLTEQGQAVIEKAFGRHSENFEQLFKIFDDEERTQFRNLLRKLGKYAETMS